MSVTNRFWIKWCWTVTHLELNHKGNDTNDAVKLNFARAGGDIGSIVLEKVASNNTTDFIINTRSFNTVSESMRITGAGRVGINQTAPQAMLQVDYDYANNEVGLRLRTASGSGTKTWQLSEINGNAKYSLLEIQRIVIIS